MDFLISLIGFVIFSGVIVFITDRLSTRANVIVFLVIPWTVIIGILIHSLI